MTDLSLWFLLALPRISLLFMGGAHCTPRFLVPWPPVTHLFLGVKEKSIGWGVWCDGPVMAILRAGSQRLPATDSPWPI
jgi:hypothetical protein